VPDEFEHSLIAGDHRCVAIMRDARKGVGLQ
jgi:hypothetical protein